MRRARYSDAGTKVISEDRTTNQSGRFRRGPAIALAAIAVALVLGFALASRGGDGTNGTPEPLRGAATSSSGAGGESLAGSGAGGQPAGLRLVDGVPAGYTNTREGAIAAAVNAELARSSAAYLTDPKVRERVLRAIMTADAAPDQIKADDAASEKFNSALGLTAGSADQLIARASPLGSKLASFSPQVATVSVWMCGIVGMTTPNAPLPVSASWTTYTLVMVWQNGDWKVSSISGSAGPTPLQTTGQKPTSVDVFASTNKEFDAPPYVG
ncbi:hypothetical protein [Kitasatospora aureofaciens]|uniref:hypothetical protein n=1 Tax=Kitasatospora aureofaciens TaxID=1894 RepID=UPI001F41FCEB|nr:hypothetical protein [Kitasatospora aureofaciens]